MINGWLHYYDMEQDSWIPAPRLTLWQRIKKHGWNARIF